MGIHPGVGIHPDARIHTSTGIHTGAGIHPGSGIHLGTGIHLGAGYSQKKKTLVFFHLSLDISYQKQGARRCSVCCEVIYTSGKLTSAVNVFFRNRERGWEEGRLKRPREAERGSATSRSQRAAVAGGAHALLGSGDQVRRGEVRGLPQEHSAQG